MRSLASLPPRYTVHPEQMRSLASLPPRYTVHPEHTLAIAPAFPGYRPSLGIPWQLLLHFQDTAHPWA